MQVVVNIAFLALIPSLVQCKAGLRQNKRRMTEGDLLSLIEDAEEFAGDELGGELFGVEMDELDNEFDVEFDELDLGTDELENELGLEVDEVGSEFDVLEDEFGLGEDEVGMGLDLEFDEWSFEFP